MRSSQSSETQDDTETIDLSKGKIVPCLDRIASIGCLYSEETDSFFHGINAFERPSLPAETSTFIPEPRILDMKVLTFDVNERFSRQKLVSCAIENAENTDKVEGKVNLKSNYINVRENDLKKVHYLIQWYTAFDYYEENIDFSAVQNQKATHFVAGIIWGAEVELEFEAKVCKDNKLDEQSFNSTFSTKVEKPKLNEANEASNEGNDNAIKKGKQENEANAAMKTHEGNAGLVAENVNASKLEVASNNFSLSTNGFRTENMPMVIDDVNSVMNSVKRGIKKVNKGKGIPIDYFLLPLPHITLNTTEETNDDSLNDILSQLRKIDQTADRVEYLIREYTESNYFPFQYLRSTNATRGNIVNARNMMTNQQISRESAVSLVAKLDQDLCKDLQFLKRFEELKKHESKIHLFKCSSSLVNFLLENVNYEVNILYIGSEWKDSVLDDFIESIESSKSVKDCKFAIWNTFLLGTEDLKDRHELKCSPAGDVNLCVRQ